MILHITASDTLNTWLHCDSVKTQTETYRQKKKNVWASEVGKTEAALFSSCWRKQEVANSRKEQLWIDTAGLMCVFGLTCRCKSSSVSSARGLVWRYISPAKAAKTRLVPVSCEDLTTCRDCFFNSRLKKADWECHRKEFFEPCTNIPPVYPSTASHRHSPLCSHMLWN